jgi:hypothetical protein
MKKLLVLNTVILIIYFVAINTRFINIIHLNESTEDLQTKVQSQVINDLPQLAVTEAVYLAEFTSYKKTLFIFDNFYIRKDKAKRFYGFKMEDILKNISIIERNNKKLLLVKLPKPHKLAGTDSREKLYSWATKDFTSLSLKTKEYSPEDEDGDPIDLEKSIRNEINAQERKLNSLLIRNTEDNARLYFQLLAQKLGLEIEIEFSDQIN